MINHARTLILNTSGNTVIPNPPPWDRYIPVEYGALTYPAWLESIRKIFVGIVNNYWDITLRLEELLDLLELPKYSQYLVWPDQRITGPSINVFSFPFNDTVTQLSDSQITDATTLTIQSNRPVSVYRQWQVVIDDSYNITIYDLNTNTNRSGGVYDINNPQTISLANDKLFKITTYTGGAMSWSITSITAPHTAIVSMVNAINKLNRNVITELFTNAQVQSYLNQYKAIYNRGYADDIVVGVALAFIAQAECIRLASYTPRIVAPATYIAPTSSYIARSLARSSSSIPSYSVSSSSQSKLSISSSSTSVTWISSSITSFSSSSQSISSTSIPPAYSFSISYRSSSSSKISRRSISVSSSKISISSSSDYCQTIVCDDPRCAGTITIDPNAWLLFPQAGLFTNLEEASAVCNPVTELTWQGVTYYICNYNDIIWAYWDYIVGSQDCFMMANTHACEPVCFQTIHTDIHGDEICGQVLMSSTYAPCPNTSLISISSSSISSQSSSSSTFCTNTPCIDCGITNPATQLVENPNSWVLLPQDHLFTDVYSIPVDAPVCEFNYNGKTYWTDQHPNNLIFTYWEYATGTTDCFVESTANNCSPACMTIYKFGNNNEPIACGTWFPPNQTPCVSCTPSSISFSSSSISISSISSSSHSYSSSSTSLYKSSSSKSSISHSSSSHSSSSIPCDFIFTGSLYAKGPIGGPFTPNDALFTIECVSGKKIGSAWSTSLDCAWANDAPTTGLISCSSESSSSYSQSCIWVHSSCSMSISSQSYSSSSIPWAGEECNADVNTQLYCTIIFPDIESCYSSVTSATGALSDIQWMEYFRGGFNLQPTLITPECNGSYHCQSSSSPCPYCWYGFTEDSTLNVSGTVDYGVLLIYLACGAEYTSTGVFSYGAERNRWYLTLIAYGTYLGAVSGQTFAWASQPNTGNLQPNDPSIVWTSVAVGSYPTNNSTPIMPGIIFNISDAYIPPPKPLYALGGRALDIDTPAGNQTEVQVNSIATTYMPGLYTGNITVTVCDKSSTIPIYLSIYSSSRSSNSQSFISQSSTSEMKPSSSSHSISSSISHSSSSHSFSSHSSSISHSSISYSSTSHSSHSHSNSSWLSSVPYCAQCPENEQLNTLTVTLDKVLVYWGEANYVVVVEDNTANLTNNGIPCEYTASAYYSIYQPTGDGTTYSLVAQYAGTLTYFLTNPEIGAGVLCISGPGLPGYGGFDQTILINKVVCNDSAPLATQVQTYAQTGSGTIIISSLNPLLYQGWVTMTAASTWDDSDEE